MKDLGRTLKQFCDALAQSQYWSPAQLATHQKTQLERLVGLARAEVPFYRDRLDALFRRNGRIDWQGWQDVPILKRSDLAGHGDAMLARRLPPGQGDIVTATSSGTSGKPVTVRVNRLAIVASDAALVRANLWHKIDYSRTLMRWDEYEPGVALWPDGRNVGPWGPPFMSGAERGQCWVLNRETPAERTLEFLAGHKPSYLLAGPASAESLASAALHMGTSIGLEAIMTRGGWIFGPTRDLCQDAFGARMIGLYSSKEALRMAHPCPESSLLHVNAETIFLEILRDDGTPCVPGELGRVVVTPLFSTAQPLIRYELGDLAVRGGECACGRALPTIARIEGRLTQMFLLPDGRRVHPQVSEGHFAGLGALSWQIAQVGPLEFEVRYVPRAPDAVSDPAPVTAALIAAIHPDARIRTVRMDALPATPAGKVNTYVCELLTA